MVGRRDGTAVGGKGAGHGRVAVTAAAVELQPLLQSTSSTRACRPLDPTPVPRLAAAAAVAACAAWVVPAVAAASEVVCSLARCIRSTHASQAT